MYYQQDRQNQIPQLCISHNCDNPVILSLSDREQHRDHEVITLDQFTDRFGQGIDDQQRKQNENLHSLIDNEKRRAIKEFDKMLTRYNDMINYSSLVRSHTIQDVEVKILIQIWKEGNVGALMNKQDEIGEIWLKGPKAPIQDAEKSYSIISKEFNDLISLFSQISKRNQPVLDLNDARAKMQETIIDTSQIIYKKLQSEKTCSKEKGHWGKQIDKICVDEQCLQNNAGQDLCCFCIEKEHSGHKTLTSIEYFNSQLVKSEKQQEQNITRLGDSFKSLNQNNHRLLRSIKKTINFMLVVFVLSLISPQFNGLFQKSVQIAQPHPVIYQNEPYKQNISEQQSLETIKHKPYQFQFDLKHQGLMLESPYIAVCGPDGNQMLALVDPALSWEPRIQKFGFRNIRGNWFALGVCDYKMVQKKGYSNHGHPWIGHGTYMISTNGWVYSTSQKEINNLQKSFQFNAIPIYVSFDPIKKQLTFQKDGTAQQFRMDIVQDDEPLHPCIWVNQYNNAVEIIQEADFPPVYQFSTFSSPSNITTLEDIFTQSEQTGYQAAFINVTLNYTGGIQKFGFMMLQDYVIYVGVCQLDYLRSNNNNPQVNLSTSSHGCYGINSIGYTMFHDQDDANNKKKPFEMVPNFPIYVYFNPAVNQITIKNSKNGGSHIINIPKLSAPLYPSVITTNVGQTVQLVQPIEIPNL